VKFDRTLLPEAKRENGTWKDLDLLNVGVGRRPSRKAGLRLEMDTSSERLRLELLRYLS
jgi:hypothetical protein